MAGISDNIEKIIIDMLDKNDGYVRIRRNELANKLNCVPSQINYVLSTRFANEQGYFIESQRGGGGGIKITRCRMDSVSKYLNNILYSFDEELTENRANLILSDFVTKEFISQKEARLLKCSYSDKALSHLQVEDRNKTRIGMISQVIAFISSQRK